MKAALCFFCGLPLDVGTHTKILLKDGDSVPVECIVPMRIVQPEFVTTISSD